MEETCVGWKRLTPSAWVKGVTVYRNAKAPQEVYLVFDWDDQKPYKDYFNLPEVQKALAESGTTGIIEVSESFHLGA